MRGMKMFLVILGGVIIAALWFLGGHSHAEEGEHHDDHDDEDDHRLIRMLHQSCLSSELASIFFQSSPYTLIFFIKQL